MTTDAEYEEAVKSAERELRDAKTADDVRNIWKKYTGSLGHRTLGRLLNGMPSERILDRHAERNVKE